MGNQLVERFVGIIGDVKDEEFAVLTALLEEVGTVLEDKIADGYHRDAVRTYYSIGGERYELWYQVRTPNTPEGANYSYGFIKVTQ